LLSAGYDTNGRSAARTRRRRDTGNPHAERLPDTTARLVTFTILTETRSGRAKTTQLRALTTLLDHEAFPAREIAALYAERWQAYRDSAPQNSADVRLLPDCR
jgi:hypothetical protein